jgi:hypothetical protein
MKSIYHVIAALLLIITTTGCKKFIEVDTPVTSTNGDNVYTSDANATAVLTGVYTKISSAGIRGGLNALSLIPALSSDELTLFGGTSNTATDFIPYYTNALSNSNTNMDFCAVIYPFIFTANSAIEDLTASTALTPAVKQQLLGEAKFIRAFCYFYLVNLFGDVPFPTSTDYKINGLLSRTSKEEIYQEVIADLVEAKTLLSEIYLGADVMTPATERVRPTKWAASALLARVYLYTGDWANAEAAATEVIANTSLFTLNSLDDVFLANSTESIWQLQPVNDWENTSEASLFVLPETGPSGDLGYPVYLSDHAVNSFDAGDERRNKWIDSVDVAGTIYHYPFKYKVAFVGPPATEYSTVLRLAEQYLIRAEARAQQNKIPDAAADLDMIRNRAGLGNTTAATQAELLTAILHERQVELFTEWGHRWFDLKRTGNINAVMSSVTAEKGGTWDANWQWYPFPLKELQRNPNLEQNTGY